MSIKKVGLVLSGVLVVAYLAAGPYLTAFNMKSAAEAYDGEKLSEYVDFITLRKSMKDQMNAMFLKETGKQAEDNPMAGLGAAFGSLFVDKIVDAYITPTGLTQMMKGKNPDSNTSSTSNKQAPEKEPFKEAEMSYESFSKFSITVPSENSKESTKFILRRSGLQWKLANIILPI